MMLVMLVGLVLAGAAWNFVFRHYWDKGIQVSIDFLSDAVYAGEWAELAEIVENRKKLPVPVIEVRFSIRRGLLFEGVENANVSDSIYKRDIFAILGMQKITRHIMFGCEKRGYYEIKDAELMASSLLYTEQYIKKLPMASAIYVYPKQVDVGDILSVSMRMLGEVMREKYLSEDPFAFRTIREYTPLDPQKTINWKASAKTGQLMVNTFDSSLRGKFMIYLDVEDSGIIKHEDLVEEGISVASSLSRRFINGGMDVGLAMNAGNTEECMLRPHSGQVQAVKINRMLAEYETRDGNCPFADILREAPEDAVMIFISKEKENQKVIEDFLGGKIGIWIFLTDERDVQAPRIKNQNLTFHIREVAR